MISKLNLQRFLLIKFGHFYSVKYLTFAWGLGPRQHPGRLVDGTGDQSHANYVRHVPGGVSTAMDQKSNHSCSYMSGQDDTVPLHLGRQIYGDELQPVKKNSKNIFIDLLSSQ